MKTYEDYCPVCAICGDVISDDEFRRIGDDCYHDSCIDTVQTDIYVENKRMEESLGYVY